MPTKTMTPREYHRRLEREMTEATLRDKHIIPLCKVLGWDWYFTQRSDRSPSGFPDLVLLRRRPAPRLVFAELKRVGRSPTAAQRRWLTGLAFDHECYVWTPRSWFDGTIERTLRGDA